jgi:hypothetical protein
VAHLIIRPKARSSWLVRLSYLAPGIIRALLAGRHPIELTSTRLLRLSKDLPHGWQEQRHFLGHRLSMAETNCAKWRRESVPVGLRETGFEAPGLFSCFFASLYFGFGISLI